MRIAICKNSFKEKLWSNQTNEKKFCIIYIHLWCEYIYVSSGKIAARIAFEKYRATKLKYRNKMEKTNQATITNQQVFCLLPKLYGILVYSTQKNNSKQIKGRRDKPANFGLFIFIFGCIFAVGRL